MERTKTSRVVFYILCAIISVLVAQSCSSSKKCGCGTDLMNAYKPSKRYR